MNYPNPKNNPARQALTRAVNKAIADDAPVYVNRLAPVKTYTTFAVPLGGGLSRQSEFARRVA